MIYEQRIALAKGLLEGCTSIASYDKFLSQVKAIKENTKRTIDELLKHISTAKEQEKLALEAARDSKE